MSFKRLIFGSPCTPGGDGGMAHRAIGGEKGPRPPSGPRRGPSRGLTAYISPCRDLASFHPLAIQPSRDDRQPPRSAFLITLQTSPADNAVWGWRAACLLPPAIPRVVAAATSTPPKDSRCLSSGQRKPTAAACNAPLQPHGCHQ